MSVEFSNAYQEILLENLTAIIKQNFLFQTQLKMNEKVAEEIQQLKNQNEQLINQINDYSEKLRLLDHYKSLVEQSSSNNQEKDRIQLALNESMQKNTELHYQIDRLNGEILLKDKNIEELNSNIKQNTNIISDNKTKILELQNECDNLKKKLDEISEKQILNTNVSSVPKKIKSSKSPNEFVALKTNNDGSSF